MATVLRHLGLPPTDPKQDSQLCPAQPPPTPHTHYVPPKKKEGAKTDSYEFFGTLARTASVDPWLPAQTQTSESAVKSNQTDKKRLLTCRWRMVPRIFCTSCSWNVMFALSCIPNTCPPTHPSCNSPSRAQRHRKALEP